MNILDLPNGVLLDILDYLTFDEVAKARLVSRRFNEVCQLALNRGFYMAVRQHTICFKRIKSLLPRRESERRHHCLARHADILTSVETRISMLSMTYTKYMDMNVCCFIPGRVLDEIFRILSVISETAKPLRPHEVLQELRDISSMAIEHFDEKIAKNFKNVQDPRAAAACLRKSIADANKKTLVNSQLSIRNDSDDEWLGTSFGPGGLDLLTSSSRFVNSYVRTCGSSDPFSSPGNTSSTSSFMSTSTNKKGCGTCGHTSSSCDAMMEYLKKLEEQHAKGMAKLTKHLQRNVHNLSEMKTELLDLRKRLLVVDGRNEQLQKILTQITCGEITTEQACDVIAKTSLFCNTSSTSAAAQALSPLDSPETSSAHSLKRRLNFDQSKSESAATKAEHTLTKRGIKRRKTSTCTSISKRPPLLSILDSDSESDDDGDDKDYKKDKSDFHLLPFLNAKYSP